MDFKKHLETAWKLTIANLIPLIFMTLVMAVVSVLTLGILAPVTLAGYIHSLILLVREGREPVCSLASAVKTELITDAILRSADSGKLEAVDYRGMV